MARGSDDDGQCCWTDSLNDFPDGSGSFLNMVEHFGYGVSTKSRHYGIADDTVFGLGENKMMAFLDASFRWHRITGIDRAKSTGELKGKQQSQNIFPSASGSREVLKRKYYQVVESIAECKEIDDKTKTGVRVEVEHLEVENDYIPRNMHLNTDPHIYRPLCTVARGASSISREMSRQLRRELCILLGNIHALFTCQTQKDALFECLQRKDDLVVCMGTGTGKSLISQLSAGEATWFDNHLHPCTSSIIGDAVTEMQITTNFCRPLERERSTRLLYPF